jgi:acetylornithine deacetylase/succinyl-diaminopimelate desuccinylase-like protein
VTLEPAELQRNSTGTHRRPASKTQDGISQACEGKREVRVRLQGTGGHGSRPSPRRAECRPSESAA